MKPITTAAAALCAVFTLNDACAQLDVSLGGITAEAFAQNIVGEGVTIISAELVCPEGAAGFFSQGETTNIGLTEGILLTTGQAADAVGPNTSGSTSTNWGAPGDADLAALVAPFPTFDACYLEFTFIPDGESVSFTYVFASEEYNQYVCSAFNDVFAFFANGPELDNDNLALLPGTDIPVTINTVNNGAPGSNGNPDNCSEEDLGNSEFFVENIGGASIEYDGFTVPLSATLDVTPGATYTFKLAIADVGDGSFDSGVFIQSGSLISEACETEGGTLLIDPTEGLCNFGAGGSTVVEAEVEGAAGEFGLFLVTDTAGTILLTAESGPIDLADLPEGADTLNTYLLWHLSYDGEAEGAVPGADAGAITGDCYALSAPLALEKFAAAAGEISHEGPAEVCIEEDAGVQVNLTGETAGTAFAWLITDADLNIIDNGSAPPFFFETAGDYLIWHLAYAGSIAGAEPGQNAGDITGTCFDLTGPVEVTAESCVPPPCEADGGIIATASPLSFCKSDEEADNTFVIDLEGASGEHSLYLATWANGNIFMTSEENVFDLAGVPGNGVCAFWHLSYSGEISGVAVGQNVNDIEGECFALSNPIETEEFFANAGIISAVLPEALCAEDLTPVSVQVSGTGGANGQTTGWIVTDTALVITALSASSSFVFDTPGTRLIWRIGFVGEIDGIATGANAADISGTCFDLSGPVEVTAEACAQQSCTADGGTLMYDGPSSFCVTDQVSVDIDAVSDTDAEGQDVTWLITDAAGSILETETAPPFIFGQAGNYQIYRLGSFGEVTGVMPSAHAEDISGDCFALSEPVSVTAATCQGGSPGVMCFEYSLYYTGYPENGAANKLYMAEIAGENVTMTEIPGFSEADNRIALTKESLIYAVRGSFIDIFDPISGIYLQENIPVVNEAGQSLAHFAAAATDSNDDLWLGRSADNTVYKVSFTDSSAVVAPQFTDVPVSGGDLALIPTDWSGDRVLLVNRTDSTLYDLSQGTETHLPLGAVHGMSAGPDGSLIFAEAGVAGGLYQYMPETGELNLLAASGGPQTYFNGNLAGGCINTPYTPALGDCYATEIVNYTEGTTLNGGMIDAERTDPQNALGAPARTDALVFVTLGYGGSLTVAFDGVVWNGPGYDLEIVETSFNTTGCTAYPEYADVYVSADGETWLSAGTVCKSEPFADISDASEGLSYITHVKLVNNDALSTTHDAFDVDGIVALHNCPEEETSPLPPGEQATAQWTGRSGVLEGYPNPTDGAARVEFKVPRSGRAVLEVFDTSGRSVAALFSGEAEAGKTYFRNFDGSRLPSGIYLYRLTTESASYSRKFMINR